MQEMTEAQIQSGIIKHYRSLGCLVLRLNSGRSQFNVWMCPPGTPDLLVLHPKDGLFWIEVKSPKGKLTHVQESLHKRLRELGQTVYVMREVPND